MRNKLEIIKQAFIANGWVSNGIKSNWWTFSHYRGLNIAILNFTNLCSSYTFRLIPASGPQRRFSFNSFKELCQFIETYAGFKIKRNLTE